MWSPWREVNVSLPRLLGLFVLVAFALPSYSSPIRQMPGLEATSIGRGDDHSSGPVPLPFALNFYGRRYETLFVNNNGNVSFGRPLSAFVPFDLRATRVPMIAAYFADVDTSGLRGGVVTYGSGRLGGRRVFGVNYSDVGPFPSGSSSSTNSFQLLLIERPDTGDGNFDIELNYARISWDLGRSGHAVAAAVGYSIGFAWGDPRSQPRSFELVGSRSSGAFLDGGPKSLSQGKLNSSVPGRYVLPVRSGEVQAAGPELRPVDERGSADRPDAEWREAQRLEAQRKEAERQEAERQAAQRQLVYTVVGGLSAGSGLLVLLFLAPTLGYPVIAIAFVAWSRMGSRGAQAPRGTGFVSRVPAGATEKAVPIERPTSEEAILQRDPEADTAHRGNAETWKAALEAHENAPFSDSLSERSVLTTFGFIRTRDGLRLGTVYYMRPLHAFLTVIQQALGLARSESEIDGQRFPVVVRPWLPIPQGSSRRSTVGRSGTCWIKCNGRLAVLTAKHAMRPKRARRGRSVSLKVSQGPREGTLLHESTVMDAAAVEVQESSWKGAQAVQNSTVIGYKPVLLMAERGARDGHVVELSKKTIFVSGPDDEPFAANVQLMDVILEPGDSGCLVLDAERQDDKRPYLMYLGKIRVDHGSYGYGLLLEQPRRNWDLQFHSSDE